MRRENSSRDGKPSESKERKGRKREKRAVGVADGGQRDDATVHRLQNRYHM